MTSHLIFDIGMHRRDPHVAMPDRNVAAGIRDLIVGAHRWRSWYLIGSAEMRRRFARARLGQLWIMLSSAISVSIIGLSWAVLWNQPVEDMLPFVAASMTIRQFLAAVVNDMTTAFPSYSHYFLNQYMPGNRPSQRSSGITKVSEAAERRLQGLRSICAKPFPAYR